MLNAKYFIIAFIILAILPSVYSADLNAHGVTLGTYDSTAVSYKVGEIILIKYNVTILNATMKNHTANPNTWYLQTSNGTVCGNVLATGTIATSGLTSDINYSAVENTYYCLLASSNGVNYQFGYKSGTATFPISNTALNWTRRVYNSNTSDTVELLTWLSIWTQNASVPVTSSSYSVTSTKIPDDINSSLVGIIYINATIQNQTSNFSMNSTLSRAELYYNVSTALNSRCAIFEQKVCVNNGNFIGKNMTFYNWTTFVNGTLWYNTTLVEKDIFPAYYPFSESFIESATSNNYSVYLNHNIRFNVYNFTTYINPFISMEFDAINLSGNSLMAVYYCNSSYITGNPATDTNCQFLNSIPALSFNFSHCHSISSCHFTMPVHITNVTKTQRSNFIIVSSATPITNGYNFRYVTNSTYDNSSFETGNYNSWTANVTSIFDIHIHQFLSNDSFNYYVKFYDGNNASNVSQIYTDYFDVVNQKPSTAQPIRPNSTERPTISTNVNTSVYFQWLPSVDFENDTLTYNLSIVNIINQNFPIAFVNQSVNNWTASLNGLYTPAGNYTIQIITCDNASNCVTGHSLYTFFLCKNTYAKSVQPCVSNTRLISYYDTSQCDSIVDSVPADNNTYESCVEIVYQQKVFEEDKWILLVLAFFLLISLIGGIMVHEAFFGLCSLLLALGFAVFIYYDYPQILMFADIFMILIFVVMWIVIHKVRRG